MLGLLCFKLQWWEKRMYFQEHTQKCFLLTQLQRSVRNVVISMILSFTCPQIFWIWNFLLGVNKAIWIWPFFVYFYKLIFNKLVACCSVPTFVRYICSGIVKPPPLSFHCRNCSFPAGGLNETPATVPFVSPALKQEILIKVFWGFCHIWGSYCLCDSSSLPCRLSLLLWRGVRQPSSSLIIGRKEVEFTPCSLLSAHHPYMQTVSQLLQLSGASPRTTGC